MPDLASLTGSTGTGKDPEIAACVAQLDGTVANITAAYQQIFAGLIAQTNQYISTSQTTLDRVTDRLSMVANAILTQAVQTGTTVRDSLSAQALNRMTELNVTLTASGIPMPALSQSYTAAGSPAGATNAADMVRLLGQVGSRFAGSQSLLPQPQNGGGSNYAGTGTGSQASGRIADYQPATVAVAGRTTVPNDARALTPISLVDRFVIVNGDGTTVDCVPVVSPAYRGVVFLYAVTGRPGQGPVLPPVQPPAVSIIYSGDATTIR